MADLDRGTTSPCCCSSGEGEAAAALRDEIDSGKRVITISGDLRPDDARAFVAATLEFEESAKAKYARARVLSCQTQTPLPNSLGMSIH